VIDRCLTIQVGYATAYAEESTAPTSPIDFVIDICLTINKSATPQHTLTPTLPLNFVTDGSLLIQVGYATAYAADQAMQKLLNDAYSDARSMLRRNRAALDELIARLLTQTADHDPSKPFQGNTLSGDEVREVVERFGCTSDLAYRESQKGVFM
jgi:hypothetical protein